MEATTPHNILRRDRKSFFFQWALTRRAARIDSISILAARRVKAH